GIDAAGLTIGDSGSQSIGADLLTSTTASAGPENIGVTPTQLTRDSGGAITYSGIETLNVSGTSGSTGAAPAQVGDLFTIALSATTTYNLDGLNPALPNSPGDKLLYNAAGASVN